MKEISLAISMCDFQPEELRNRTRCNFDWMDRLRILFGKTAHVEIDITLNQPQGKTADELVQSTESRVWVERLFPRKQSGGYAVTPKRESDVGQGPVTVSQKRG